MKQFITPIAIIVVLIVLFVIVDHKEFYRHNNDHTTQVGSHDNKRITSSVIATETKTETMTTREVKPEFEIPSEPQAKTIGNKDSGKKLAPVAVPVTAQEGHREASEETIDPPDQQPVEKEEKIISPGIKTIAFFIAFIVVIGILAFYLAKELKKSQFCSSTGNHLITKQNIKRTVYVFFVISVACILLFGARKMMPYSEDIVLSYAIMNRIGDVCLNENDIKSTNIYYATESDPVLSERQKIKMADILAGSETLFKRELEVTLPRDCNKVRIDLSYDTKCIENTKSNEYPDVIIKINGREIQEQDYKIERWSSSSRVTFPITITDEVLKSSPKSFYSVWFSIAFIFVIIVLFACNTIKKQNVVQNVFLILFFLLSLFPTFKFNLKKESEQENRTLERFPEDFYIDKASDYFSQFELWFNDRFFGREKMIAISDKVMNLFDDRGSEKALKGKENWLFYKETLPEKYIKNIFSEDEMNKAGEYLNSINQYAQSNGKKFLFVICPDKYRIYGDKAKIYSSDLYLRDNSIDKFVEYLRNHYDFPVIYSRKDLLQKRAELEHDLYFRYDTHWTQEGAYYGFYVPVTTALSVNPIDVKKWEGANSNSGDLINMLTNDKTKIANIVPQKYFYPSIDKKASIEKIDDPVGPNKIIKAVNPTGVKNVLFYRDSFSSAAVDLFSNTFQESTFLWHNPSLESDLNYLEESDVIILEKVERYVFDLPSLTPFAFGE